MIDEVTEILFEEIADLRKVMAKMQVALANPGDERRRVLALAAFEQLYRAKK